MAANKEAETRYNSATMVSSPNIAIVGATGVVGQEFLTVLAQRQFPMARLRLLASSKSRGRTMSVCGRTVAVEELNEDSFKSIDLAFFSAGGSVSKHYAPIASAVGCTVVDNSSAFRMADDVPLVVPEVNAEVVREFQAGKGGIIANPNCSTIIMLLPVTPLYRAAGGVRRMVVSTYQAASGAGARGIAELKEQTQQVLDGRPLTCDFFPQQYAFNLFSHNSDIGPEGYNTEELKMVREAHKIWGDDTVQITATCVRVPVVRAHSESIHLEFAEPLTEDEARRILAESPGVLLLDDRDNNRFPTPIDATGKDEVYVGRIRNDMACNGSVPMGMNLFICGDQLRKGAALNAVQIAELIL